MKALAIGIVLAAGLGAAAQDVHPRTTQEMPLVEEGEKLAKAGHASDAVERFLKVLDDPDTVDIFVGNPDTVGALPALRPVVRERARRLAESDAAFKEAWEKEALSRLARLGAQPARRGLEKVAGQFPGTPAARQALRKLAAMAWESAEPARAARLWEECGESLTASEGARLAAGRRAAGLGPSAGEWMRRWEASGALGVRPKFDDCNFPKLDETLVVRGERVTLADFLATLKPQPAATWRGERNAGATAFPKLKGLKGPPQVLSLYGQLPGNTPAAPANAGIVFRDPGAYDGATALRLLPWGNGAVAASRAGLSLLEIGPDGKWRAAGGARGSAPLASAGLSTDGTRIFTVIPDPSARLGAIRLVPAAFRVEGSDFVPAWSSGPVSGNGGFDDGWVTGAPTLCEGRLFVPVALLDSVYTPGIECLDAATGERVWSTTLAESKQQFFSATTRVASSPPWVSDGVVMFASGEGFVAALDAATGDPLWISTYFPNRGVAGGWVDAPPRAAGRRAIFAPLDADALLRLDLFTGQPIGSPAPAILPTFRYLLADGDRVVLAGSDGALAGEGGPRGAVKVMNSSASRDVLWELPDPPAGRPAVSEGRLEVPTERGLYEVDLETGAVEVLVSWKPEEAGDVVRLPGGVAVLRNGEIRFWEESK